MVICFDQINSNNCVNDLLKGIIIDREVEGVSIPPLIVPIAICYPFVKNYYCENNPKLCADSKLVYNVNPLAPSYFRFI